MSPLRSIRTGLATFGVTVAGLLLASAPALAAPEAPETTTATAITAASATLHGVLNPAAPSEGGSYRFTYKQSETECEPEGTLRPELPALALGKEKEAVSVGVTGLEPNKPYTFCLIASNLSTEATTGSLEHFSTLALPPSIDSEGASAVNSSSANLEALINTNNEATTYSFEYATKATGEKLEGAITTLPGAELPPAFGDQGASISTGAALSEGTTYFYRVVAENEKSEEEGKPVKGKVEAFTTVPAPHTDAVTAVTATTALFHGHLTLNPVDTTFSFDYNVGAACGGLATTPEDAGKGAGSHPVSTEATGLEPSASYSVCLVSSNASGSEVDPLAPPVSFTTLPAPPSVDSEMATVRPFEATLEAFVNANNQETTYKFAYATNEAMTENVKVLTPPEGTPPFAGVFGDQYASISTGHVLTPGTHYFYRLIAENVAHEKIEGKPTELNPPALEKPAIEPGTGASAIGPRSANLEAFVNPDYQETTYIFEYATNEAMTENVGTISGLPIPAVGGAQYASVPVTGLVSATEYYFRITATNQTGTTQGPVVTPAFKTLVVPHVNETKPEATTITQHTALIANITINPEMEEPPEPNEPARYYILYGGPDEGYDNASPAPTHAGAGFGFTGTAVPSLTLSGLTPGTTYHYEVVASNVNGTETGPPNEFTTLPALVTTPPAIGSASSQFVNENSAVIEADVNPEGLSTNYEVQYGTSTGYGSAAPAGQLAPFTSLQGTITALVGLAPGTTYHFRLVASNQAGTTFGPDATFSTSGATLTTAFTSFTVPAIPPTPTTPFTFPVEGPGTTSPPKALTRKQKLAAALKACRKKKSKGKRAACVRHARREFR